VTEPLKLHGGVDLENGQCKVRCDSSTSSKKANQRHSGDFMLSNHMCMRLIHELLQALTTGWNAVSWSLLTGWGSWGRNRTHHAYLGRLCGVRRRLAHCAAFSRCKTIQI
jgi:hypothetical protein